MDLEALKGKEVRERRMVMIPPVTITIHNDAGKPEVTSWSRERRSST